MHTYGDSFGFLRSYEHLISGAEGEYIIPPSGDGWLQGDLVSIDSSTGCLIPALSNSPLLPNIVGILTQRGELRWTRSLTNLEIINTRDFSQVVAGQAAVLLTGRGLKLWYQNLAAVTTSGQRPYSAESRVDVTGLVVGDWVCWDAAAKRFKKTSNAGYAVGVCNAVSGTGTTAGARIEFTLLG